MNKMFFTFIFASFLFSGVQASYAMKENLEAQSNTKKRKEYSVPKWNHIQNQEVENNDTPPPAPYVVRTIRNDDQQAMDPVMAIFVIRAKKRLYFESEPEI